MRKEVIFLIFLVVCMSFSYAKVVDVPEVKDDSEPLRDGMGVKKFVYAGSSIIASIEDSEIKYYHKDRLSNRLITNENGNKVGDFLSLPFGQRVINSGVDYPFTGKEEDESSLYYFGARYYDDNLGRFVSVDPVASEPAYQYVSNNPMNYVDPTGMEEIRNGAWGDVVNGEVIWHNPPMAEEVPDSTDYSYYTMGDGEWVWGHVLPLTPEGRTSAGDERLRGLNSDLYDKRGGWEGVQPGDVIKYVSADSDTYYANRISRVKEKWLVDKFMEFLNDPRWTLRYESTAVEFLQGQGLSGGEAEDFLWHNSPPTCTGWIDGQPKFSRGEFKGAPVVYDHSNPRLGKVVGSYVPGEMEGNKVSRWWSRTFFSSGGAGRDTVNVRLGDLIDPYYMQSMDPGIEEQ
jgi:RHS repeat-associated protein